MMPTRRSYTRCAAMEAQRSAAGHLQALGGLVDCSAHDPTPFFEQGLAMLVQRLGLDWALLSRSSAEGMTVLWWATADGGEPPEPVQVVAHSHCPRVLANPGRTWVCRDAISANAPCAGLLQLGQAGVQACLGVSLTQSPAVQGVLTVLSRSPRRFTRAETAMVKALANLFGKALEIEQLKYDLKLSQDALELTSAVMEDSRLEAPASQLPNRLYLEVWMKASLFMARRRGEAMVLVRWHLPAGADLQPRLKAFAEALRGEDLLVDLGKGEFLLLLPHTTQAGAVTLMERLRQQLGPLPMGGTLWNPLHRLDREDLVLKAALKRAGLGLRHSRETQQDGAADLVWELLGEE